MARTDFRTPRLYVPQDLAAGIEVKLDPQQTNYLVNVLRLGAGAPVLLFNGRDGEFSASLNTSSRKAASLVVGTRTRAQEQPPDVDYLFAPLKHARLDYMAQKAIEMGARRLRPVVTRHTQVARVNLERLRANAIEACEQCGVIWAPEIAPVEPLAEALKSWPAERLLVFCDEEAEPNECARRARKRARGRRRRPPDWAGRRIRRRRARCDPLRAARAAPEPGAAHPAGRHRRRGGAGAHSGHAGRLAEKTHAGVRLNITGPACHFAATMRLHPGSDDSPFGRRVAQGCWGRCCSGGAVIGAHCSRSIDSCQRRGQRRARSQSEMRGSYCGGSDEDSAPVRAGCARIRGYITAGERFGSDDRIGGPPGPFAPLDEPGVAGARFSSGLTVIGAPLSGDRLLAPTGSGDIAR